MKVKLKGLSEPSLLHCESKEPTLEGGCKHLINVLKAPSWAGGGQIRVNICIKGKHFQNLKQADSRNEACPGLLFTVAGYNHAIHTLSSPSIHQPVYTRLLHQRWAGDPKGLLGDAAEPDNTGYTLEVRLSGGGVS